MKTLTSLPAKLLVLSSMMALSLTSAHATNRFWIGGAGGTTGTASMTVNGNWADNANGSGTNNAPDTNDTAVFGATSVPIATNITATLTANSTFGEIYVAGTGSTTLGEHTGTTLIESSSTTDHTLTLGATTSSTLIDVEAGAGDVTIGDSSRGLEIQTAAAGTGGSTYAITNNSAGILTIQNDLTVEEGANNRTSTLSINGTGTGGTVFNGNISDDNGTNQHTNLSVGAGSKATLNAATDFSGTTTVAANGVLTLAAANALGGTSSITVTGGTLNVNAVGATNTTVSVTSGGSLVFGSNNTTVNQGLSSGTNVSLNNSSMVLNGATQTIGTLTLTGAVTIDMSKGGVLTIGQISWTTGATLTIIGWSGSLTTGGDATHKITLSAGGGTGAWNDMTNHLGAVTWTDTTVGSDTGTVNSASRTGSQFVGGQLIPGGTPVTPAPEPSTIFIGLGLIALLAWGGRNKIAEAGRSLASVRS